MTTQGRALGRLLRRYPDLEVQMGEHPWRVWVAGGGRKTTLGFDANSNDDPDLSDGTAAAGSTAAVGVVRGADGTVYGSTDQMRVVASRVHEHLVEPARAALIQAHWTLRPHYPGQDQSCVACGEEMPCTLVAEQVAVLLEHEHLDPWEELLAEQGDHGCHDWIYPYRF